jgi:GTP-binding protein HflX
VPVADRTGLILEIFAQRARSHEGKLQVELARCSTWPRAWCGAGATWSARRAASAPAAARANAQIELDRRMIGERIKQLKSRLGKVEAPTRHAAQGARAGRQMRVSLVGYTNAGKSTSSTR